MPLHVGNDAIFCLDFARGKSDYVPYETTIPGLVYRKLACDRTAFEFDSEKVTMSFGKIKNEMEKFAAGLLSVGLKQKDRILICGNNYSNLLIAVLGSARNGMIFSIGSPNFQNASQIQHLLSLGEFTAFIYFGESDCVNQFLLEISPEMIKYPKGKLKLKAFPKLSHVIYADENHKHGGTYTLSDIFLNGNSEQIVRLPKIDEKNCHKIGSIQFTMGTTGLPKAVALTHYQLVNGCRIAANAIGIKKETVLCIALPLFRIPIFALSIFSPLLFESKTIFPEPNPLPKFLFDSIKKYQCTNLLSNATALRLILRTQPLIQKKQITITTIDTVILLGERVSADLLISIENIMPKAKKIAVGMISTELGAIPILSDQTTNLIKSVGKILEGFQADIIKIDNFSNNDGGRRGELLLKALARTKFMGFAPNFNNEQEWIGTSDVVCVQKDGNIEIISHIQDLVFDKIGRLVEYWKLERLLAQLAQQIKGVQIIQLEKGSPIVAVVAPKRTTAKLQIAELKKEIIDICREQQLDPPDQLAILEDFPRVNTKIQKYKMREELRAKKLQIY